MCFQAIRREHSKTTNDGVITRTTPPPHAPPPPPRQATIKPQYVDHIPKAVRGNVGDVIDSKDERGQKEQLLKDLDLEQVCVCVCAHVRALHSCSEWVYGQGICLFMTCTPKKP